MNQKSIVNFFYPICKNCHYYQPIYIENFVVQYKICKFVKHKNLITGRTEYMKALDCRMNEDNCNVQGYYFKYKVKNII